MTITYNSALSTETNNNTSANSITLPSTTVPAKSAVVLALRWEGGGASDAATFSVTSGGGGLTFTPAEYQNSGGASEDQRVGYVLAVAEAETTIAPVLTISEARPYRHAALHVFEYTGDDISVVDLVKNSRGVDGSGWSLPELSGQENDMCAIIYTQYNAISITEAPAGFSTGANSGLMRLYYDTLETSTITPTAAGGDSFAAIGFLLRDEAAAAPILSTPSVTDLQPGTGTANINTNTAGGTIYALYSTNATELAAAIKGGVSQAVSATGAQSIALTGLPLGEAGYVHFIQTADGQDSNIVSYGFTTAAKMTQSTTATVALPAGYSMVELSGELYTRGLTQLQRTPQPGWQMIGLTSEIEWAADGSAQVKKIDAPFNVWIADEFGKLSRIVYDATGLSAAVFPAAPTFSNVTGAEPSATGSQSFVLSVPDHPAETISIQGIGVGATVRNGAGAAASSVTGVHGDTIHIDWVASDEFNTPETFGVEMTGGVSAYFTVTTRAAAAPSITAQPSGPAATSVGVAVTIDATVTGYSSLQWYSNGVAIPGATSLPLTFTPAAVGAYSLTLVAESSEGASVTSSAHVVTALAAATRIQIPANVEDVDGNSMAGQTVTVEIYTDNNNRRGTFLRSTQVTLAAAGNPTNIDSNENGAVGTVRWYVFPGSNQLARTEAAYQTTVVAI